MAGQRAARPGVGAEGQKGENRNAQASAFHDDHHTIRRRKPIVRQFGPS